MSICDLMHANSTKSYTKCPVGNSLIIAHTLVATPCLRAPKLYGYLFRLPVKSTDFPWSLECRFNEVKLYWGLVCCTDAAEKMLLICNEGSEFLNEGY